MWGPALVVALALITGAVAATQGTVVANESETVGICHATGDDQSPYVYVVVARDGADHGHHGQHEGDVMDVASEADCPATSAAAEEEPVCSDAVAESSDVDAAAAPAEATSANTTSGNATANESAEPTEASDPELEGLCDADVAAGGAANRSGSWVVFEFTATSGGANEADDVLLDASLPDVGRAWRFADAATAGCLLENLTLACEYGDLRAGALRTVTVKAPRCAADCGDDLEAEVSVSAHNDGNASNDEASVVLVVEDCPRGQPAPATTSAPAPSPAPNASEPAPNTSEPAPNATEPAPPANNTTALGNQTNTTEPAPDQTEPEPATSDVSIAQRVDQDVDQVVLTIVVRSIGDASAANVTLVDTLPDVRRSWHLGGADAGDCTLDGQYLNCWFGDLDAGASRTIVVKAYTDRMRCGQHLTNIPQVSSDGDANPRNDRATASIEARSC